MKQNRVFIVIIVVVIFSMLTGLTASTAQSTPLTVQPIILNADMTSAEVVAALPRGETLYFNALQWGSVVCWNPYSSNCNNAMAIVQQDNARVTVFETPYIYNMLTGEQFPLLADGPYKWNKARTEITFKIKPAAKWNDGTRVTAGDVAYTWAANVRYETQAGINFRDFIDAIIAVDSATVRVKAKLDGNGKAVNPLLVSAYLSNNYVIQKAWTQRLEVRTGGDASAFQNDPALDFISSGPYKNYNSNDQIIVLIRDDNYWGQEASMWGRLPSPKYLAHVIYADNNAANDAFKAGEVDVSQMFIPNVQDLWLVDGLPVSTYLPDAPYMIGATLPTAFYNLKSFGLDQLAIRQATAMAVDYDAIIADAMTNQSATFTQVPRSLMNPSPYEQSLYDHDAVAGLQWAGNDIAGAKKLLDDAGITDTNYDGWRELNGQTLHYVATCPYGWTDWMAAIEVVAAAGQAIGIDITTNYPEWSDYQNVVTNWSQLPDTGYDIFMMWSDGAGPAEPWNRVRHLISSEFYQTDNNWNGNWGGYTSPAADAIIQRIPTETDPTKLKADYTELTRIYLTDIPSFTLMYRPQSFHTVNESIWTGFPHQGDGTKPPVPPLDLIDGYSIAGLYNIQPKFPRNETLYIGGIQWETPWTFNPLNGSVAWPASGNHLLTYETLFAYNQLTGNLDPLLAVKLKLVNPTTMRITLQDGTMWQDGQPLTTADIVYTYELAKDHPSLSYGDLYNYISEIKATGDRTLQITLNSDNKNPGVVKNFLSQIKILPRHIWLLREEDGLLTDYVETNPVGSGPYKLYDYSNQRITLIRNDKYWGKGVFGLPAPKFIIHQIYGTNNDTLQAFQNGAVDLNQMFIMPQTLKLWRDQNLPIGTWYDQPPYYLPGSIPILIINTQEPGLDNPLLRRALAYSIDYGAIANDLWSYSVPVNSSLILPVGGENALFNPAQVAQYGWSYNPDAAIDILQDLPETPPIGPWTVDTPCGWTDWQIAIDIVAQNAQAAGFDLTSSCSDWGTLNSNLYTGDFDMILWYITGSSPASPWARFRDMLADGNYGRFSDPTVAGLLNQAAAASDPTTVKFVYDQLDKIFMDNVVGIPLMYRPNEFYEFNQSYWTGFPTSTYPSAPPMFSGAGIELLYKIRPLR